LCDLSDDADTAGDNVVREWREIGYRWRMGLHWLPCFLVFMFDFLYSGGVPVMRRRTNSTHLLLRSHDLVGHVTLDGPESSWIVLGGSELLSFAVLSSTNNIDLLLLPLPLV
jgi:hypothetical protein